MKDKIIEILKKPADERSFSRFNPEFLAPRQELSLDEHARIKEIFPNPAGLPKRQVFNFLVNLSYASSKLEGNTYTEIDTVTLLEDSIPSATNSNEETKMILNHKHAFDLLIRADKVDRDLITQLHSRLADNSGVESSHHFLEPEFLGKVRTYDEVTIGNTRYSPMSDTPGKRPTVSDHLDSIINSADGINNPLEKAFYLFTRLPYLQAFRDCNKRTSRLAGNLPLLLANEYPISFMGFSRPDYNRSMIAFYEFGNTELFKDGFVEAYLHSAVKFHPLPPTASIEIQSMESTALRKELSDYVIAGKPSHSVDILKAAAKESSKSIDDDFSPSR